MPDLDRAAFETWLRAQPPEAVVGTGYHSEACPAARWLQGTDQGEAWVARETYGLDSADYQPAPPWLRAFTERIDDCYRQQPITAAEALRVLAEVPA